MSIFKKKSKVSPQLFTLTFYIAILGFLFGAFGLSFGLLNNSSLHQQQQTSTELRSELSQLYYCNQHAMKVCTDQTIQAYEKSH